MMHGLGWKSFLAQLVITSRAYQITLRPSSVRPSLRRPSVTSVFSETVTRIIMKLYQHMPYDNTPRPFFRNFEILNLNFFMNFILIKTKFPLKVNGKFQNATPTVLHGSNPNYFCNNCRWSLTKPVFQNFEFRLC